MEGRIGTGSNYREFTGSGGNNKERQVGIGRYPRAHFSAKYLGTVVTTKQLVDDVLRDRCAVVPDAITGFHRLLAGDVRLLDLAIFGG